MKHVQTAARWTEGLTINLSPCAAEWLVSFILCGVLLALPGLQTDP